MSFPLLSLPYVALADVRKQFGLQELCLISTLSKRVKRLFTSSKNIKNEKQSFDIDDCSFQLSREGNKMTADFRNLDEKSEDEYRWCIKLGVKSSDNIRTYLKNDCDDEKESFFKILEHSIEVFNISKVNRLNFDEMDSDQVRKLIGILKKRNVQLKDVFVGRSCESEDKISESSDKVLLTVLEECNTAEGIYSVCKTTPNFVVSLKTPLEVDNVTIGVSPWVTKDNVIDLFMNCKTLNLYNCEFNKDELIEIYSKWMQGSRIEEFTLGSNWMFHHEVFGDMPGVVRVQRARIPTMYHRDYIGECYMIEQITGQKAVVFCNTPIRSKWFISLTTDFELIDE